MQPQTFRSVHIDDDNVVQSIQPQQPKVQDTLPISQTQSSSGRQSAFKATAVKFLGFTQIGLGALCILLHVILFACHAPYAKFGHGIWGGVHVSLLYVLMEWKLYLIL